MTANDTFTTKVGMRTFEFDPITHKPMLNGKIYMLRGTNFCMYRFFEDCERGNRPWDREWARTVIRKHKSMNMNVARYCIGFPPELWYELADEEGLLVQDEFPIWVLGWRDNSTKPTPENLKTEVTDWIYERNNHPCVFIWDIQNENTDKLTGPIIVALNSLDLQKRPWDNGWDPPQSPIHSFELHSYFNAADTGWTTEKLGGWAPIDQYAIPPFAVIVNEYGWIWVNRDGTSTKLTKRQWEMIGPNSTVDERRYYHAMQMGQETEWFRAQRHAAFMQFCGLGYTRPGTGETSDNWTPGLATPTYFPLLEERLRDAFAPVGLMIQYWQRKEGAGAKRDINVYVMNDKPAPWSGTVTLKIMVDTTVYASVVDTFTNVPTGYRASKKYSITFPSVSGSYKLIAEYTENNVKVRSVRDVKIEAPCASVGKPVTASSTKDANVPTQVNDGKTSTRWSSEFSDPQWISVDFGAAFYRCDYLDRCILKNYRCGR